jgi:hypothetical protein
MHRMALSQLQPVTKGLHPAPMAQALERGARPQNDVLDSFSKEQVREFGDVELDPHM